MSKDNNVLHQIIRIALISTVSIICGLIAMILLVPLLKHMASDYTTTNIAEYGDYVNVMEKYQKRYIDSFFPQSIQDKFINPTYSFRSSAVDSCGFEAYLEFTFEDPIQFEEFVQNSTKEMQEGTFYFDDTYLEYVFVDQETGYVCDGIMLDHEPYIEKDGTVSYFIDSAIIAKVLINSQERRVIFVSLVVIDGGGTPTSVLSTYFERFNIDPKEYELYTETVKNLSPSAK